MTVTKTVTLPRYLIDFQRPTNADVHSRGAFQTIKNLLTRALISVDVNVQDDSAINDTSEQDRVVYNLTAGDFVLDGCVLSFVFSGAIANAGDKNIRVYLAGTELLQLDITTGTKTWVVDGAIHITGAATQVVYTKGVASDGTVVASVLNTAANLAAAQVLKLTGQSASGSVGSVVSKTAQLNVQFEPYAGNV